MEKSTQLLKLEEKITQKKKPIHLVTSTYLDSSRYHKFFYVWTYLGLISIFQWIQFLYVKDKSITWREALSNWLQRLKYLENQKDFKWLAFKEDFLPHSINSLLDDISTNDEIEYITPLVSMGASYVNITNITKYTENKIKKKLNPMKLHLGEDSKFLMEAVHTTNKDLRKNLELNYKEWSGLTEPSWKSRFVMSPQEYPDEENLNKLNSDDINMSYEDIGEEEDEFDDYIFEELLNELKDEISKRKLKTSERNQFILENIEKDRERILKETIQKMHQ
eukprot:gene5688-9509_t